MAITIKPQWMLALAGWVLALGLLFLVWRALERPVFNGPGPGAAGETPDKEDSALALDPVGGEKLAKGAPNVKAIYQGRDYWFTGNAEKFTFLTDPEKYLGGKSILAGISATAQPEKTTPAAIMNIKVEPTMSKRGPGADGGRP